MAIWKNSNMFSTTFGAKDIDNGLCEVLIDDNRIVVSYFIDGHGIEYTGVNNNDGHFRVQCRQLNGSGTLHKFKDENILEGSWVEGGYEGFWKIELK
jgi:hypothetical protein